MKWITQNYKGEEQVWYSEDVMQKIREKCEEYHQQFCCNVNTYQFATDILQIIESED